MLGLFPFFFQKQALKGLTCNPEAGGPDANAARRKEVDSMGGPGRLKRMRICRAAQGIHVMDQEADRTTACSGALCARHLRASSSASGRSTNGRTVTVEGSTLQAVEATVFREAMISSRSKAQATKPHPQRKARIARLSVRASSITLKKTVAAHEAELDNVPSTPFTYSRHRRPLERRRSRWIARDYRAGRYDWRDRGDRRPLSCPLDQ